ncbi:MAG: DUF4150 domain-containing protein [Gammaproteobacteria bacterium]|nr:DUF4150 domain-containing protein [Gammaproteobacteria bacterium]
MFLNINLGVLNLCFPDVCYLITPVGPIPLPLVNLTFSCTKFPPVFRVIIGGGMSENLFSFSPISIGDEAGTGMGMISGMIIGPDHTIIGSFTVFLECAPATHMLSLTIQNMINGIGLSLTLMQPRVLVCS